MDRELQLVWLWLWHKCHTEGNWQQLVAANDDIGSISKY